MKDILITTFSNTYNKGANLQMFALKECFESLGLRVKFLNFTIKDSLNFKGKIWSMINNYAAVFFRKTVDINFTKRYESYQELVNFPPEADIYLVGSDQVWNNELTYRLDSRIFYYCYLPANTLKYSYAASFGVNGWTQTPYDDEIKESVKSFAKISVREDNTVELASLLFDRDDVRHDLDPTLLLSKDSLQKLYCSSHSSHKEAYAYCYLLYKDEHITTLLNGIFSRYGGKIRGYAYNLVGKIRSFCGVRKWVKNIAESELVITNSFHCLVFAILYHKEFLVVPSYPQREIRLLSLLRLINLEHRYISTPSELDTLELSNIDYSAVESCLEKYRLSSLRYIKDEIIG